MFRPFGGSEKGEGQGGAQGRTRDRNPIFVLFRLEIYLWFPANIGIEEKRANRWVEIYKIHLENVIISYTSPKNNLSSLLFT